MNKFDMTGHQIRAISYVGLAGICLLLGTAVNAAKPVKTQVCHVPPDNPGNVQIIEVGSNGGALLAHILHGDWVVDTEPNCDTIADNDCDGVPDDTADGDAYCDDGDEATIDTCDTRVGECVYELVAAGCPCAAEYSEAASLYLPTGGLSDGWLQCFDVQPGPNGSTAIVTYDNVPGSTTEISLVAYGPPESACEAAVLIEGAVVYSQHATYTDPDEQQTACIAAQDFVCSSF